MPLYQGELLETRLTRRPRMGLEEGRAYRDRARQGRGALCIAPASSIATSSRTMSFSKAAGSLKLVDLGVVRVPGLEDFPPEDIPGTPAYMAPEMFEGEAGNEATDIYALGVTMFRAFTGEFPYGNPDADQPAAPRPAERTLPPCAPICPRGSGPFSGGRSPPIHASAFAT